MYRLLLSLILIPIITASLSADPPAPGKSVTFRQDGGVHAVALSPDGKILATGGDSIVTLWDTETRKERHRLEAHRSIVHALAFSPDGNTLATAGRDRVIHLWDPSTGKSIRELTGHVSAVTALVFTRDGKTLISGSFDGTVRLWGPSTGKELRSIEGHDAEIRGVALSQDGTLIATASYDKTARLWDAKTGKELRKLQAHRREVLCVAISPDGRTVATGGADMRIFLWDAATGEELRGIHKENGVVFALAFSPDGQTLAVASGPHLFLHETATGKVRHQLAELPERVLDVAFSLDGRSVVVGNGAAGTALLVSPFPAVPDKLTGTEIEKHWDNLASPDAAAAWTAIAALITVPKETVPFFKKQFEPPPPADEKRIARLLKDMESDDFVTREKATQELERVGPEGVKAVQKFLMGSPSVDAKRRAERVLQKIDEDIAVAGVRSRRVVECLEWMATPEARQLLKTFSQGIAEVPLTRDAKAALERLERRP